MIIIDGTNGGGQILRCALTLSTILNKPFSMTNIRGQRKKPGLKHQHLTCIETLKEITNAICDAKLGDSKIEFTPGKPNSTKKDIDIKTAGSITLLLQCILPVLIHSKKISNLKITGGTDVNWSPSSEYYKDVVIPALEQYAKIKFNILKRGFYPKGQGQVELMVKPTKEFNPIEILEKGEIVQINGTVISTTNFSDDETSDRIKKAQDFYLNKLDCPKLIQSAYARAESNGMTTTLVAKYTNVNTGSDVLAQIDDKNYELLGETCAKILINRMNDDFACDEHLADNLIPYIALYGGQISTQKITEHIKNCVDVTNQFLDDGEVLIEEKENKIIIKRLIIGVDESH